MSNPFDLPGIVDDGAMDAMGDATKAVLARRRLPPDEADAAKQRALADITRAVQSRDIAEINEGALPARMFALLRRMRDRPEQADQLVADAEPGIAAAALSCLWDTAKHEGRLRVLGDGTSNAIQVIVRGQWCNTSDWQVASLAGKTLEEAAEIWLALLATDSDQFRQLVIRTLAAAETDRSEPDPLRPLRDLARNPSMSKLRTLVRNDRTQGPGAYLESVLGRAAWNLSLFGDGDVPDDWLDRLELQYGSDLPEQIRRLAAAALEFFKRHGPNPGRRPDRLTEHFADRMAEIYEGLAGKAITYTKTTSSDPNAARVRGVGLDFMLASLRLLDPATSPNQAAAQIDRIRKARTARLKAASATSPIPGLSF